jgi:ABC-type lipoprotein release transport system permease subunit
VSRRPRPLRHRRFQQALAVAALATAVALPVVLLSVGGGVAQHELAALASSGFQVSLSAAGLHGIANAHGLTSQIDHIPNVAAASPILSQAIDTVTPTRGFVPVLAEGVIPSGFQQTEGATERSLFPATLDLGDPTDTQHYANGTYAGAPSNKVLVSSPLATAQGLRVGMTLDLAPAPKVTAATTYTITGIFGVPPSLLGPTAAFAIVLPLSNLQVMTGHARGGANGSLLLDAVDTVQVALVPSAASDTAAIRAVAAKISSLAPFYGVSSQLEEAKSIREAQGVLNGFYVALSSVALVVGLVFLTLVLVRKVETERPVIGVQRAIGVPARLIAGGMAREGILLAGAGIVGGVLLGILVITLLAHYGSGSVATVASDAVYDPTTLVALGAAILGLAALGSLVPTRLALRLSIPEVLR